MMRNRLSELVPPLLTVSTQDVVIEPSLAYMAEALCARVGLPEKGRVLVCDRATHAALGKRIAHELALPDNQMLILDAPHADEATLNVIRNKHACALIAVGSGTISDLCKYASFLDDTPYVIFATAPSMNGYLSANASLTLHGHKQTLTAHLPLAVWCDLSVIAAAPARLILSGLGDSLCRPTAQADWLLSHLLLDTHYDPLPFAMLAPYEKELFAEAARLTKGDSAIIELLLRTLLVSGLGMVIAAGSYPASEGEHLIAHTMEMKHAAALQHSFHGEQIGVTTLTMATLQEQLLSQPLKLATAQDVAKDIQTYFGEALTESVRNAYEEKAAQLTERRSHIEQRLAKNNAEIRDKLRQISLPATFLKDVLVRAGAKTTPQNLGWNVDDYKQATKHAHFIRNRFTFLDLIDK